MEGLLKALFKMIPNGTVQKAVLSLIQTEFEEIDDVDDLRDLTIGRLLDKWDGYTGG